MPAGRGTGPPEGPVTSSLAPRVPLSVPNYDDDMPALADMSSAQAVDRSIAHFRIRDSGVARLRPKREAAPCGPPSTRCCRCGARRIASHPVILFLASTLLSYFALRTPNGGVGLEGYADLQLLAGLVLLVTCGSMLTWELGGVSRHRPVGTDCCWRTCC